jgi:hypothetical protein
MKSAAKKRRADQGATWSDESEASLMFFKEGERNAAEEVADYTHEVAAADRLRRRGWLLLLLAMAVALAAGVAVAVYLTSS